MLEILSLFLLMFVISCQSQQTVNWSFDDDGVSKVKSAQVVQPETRRLSNSEEKRIINELEKKQKVVNQKKSKQLKFNNLVEVPNLNEKQLYKYIYTNYKKNNYNEVLTAVSIFRNKFKNSRYTDDVIYLLSQLDFRLGKYSASLLAVEEILKEHKNSSLYSNALYLKAQVYKKLNISSVYTSILEDIGQLPRTNKVTEKASLELEEFNSQGRKN